MCIISSCYSIFEGTSARGAVELCHFIIRDNKLVIESWGLDAEKLQSMDRVQGLI